MSETVYRFLTLYRYLRRYSRQMQSEGLSGRKISALRYLHDEGACTIGQLASYLYISNSSTSGLVDRLQKTGYVTRTRSSADNRVVIVALTPEGTQIACRTELGGIPLLREKLLNLPPEKRTSIDAALTELLQILEIEDE